MAGKNQGERCFLRIWRRDLEAVWSPFAAQPRPGRELPGSARSIKLAELEYKEFLMREIGAFDAKNSLGMLLDLVQKGEEIVITRHGKPVARLIPETGSAEKRLRAQAAIHHLRDLRKGITLGGIALRDLVDAGRP
jgi:prevent-host-death family protein